MELSPTAYVILGMVRDEPRSGYEIKAMVDRSVRFFWAASYGQIYPELRKLAKAGLVEPEAQPTGRRKRILYRLTEAGREELRNWLDLPSARLELRDEGLLKLFFAGAAEPGKAIEMIDAKQRLMEEKLAALREIEPFAAAAASTDPFPYLVLRYGMESSEWVIAWCARARAELTGAVPKSANRKRRAG
ncbi:MAG TPA: PadR family transcriptional regulator [Thermoleophilaceae bacterium]|nr:PadR family transcriptional regulator [Thermoleophilaceae bacterium]